MINILSVIRGHRQAALEHIENYGLSHKTTWMQSVMVTIHDLLYFKTITINDAYVIYEIINKRTIGVKMALIVSIYVPKDKRGKGIANKLIDLIPEKTIISDRGKYEKVSELRICRK